MDEIVGPAGLGYLASRAFGAAWTAAAASSFSAAALIFVLRRFVLHERRGERLALHDGAGDPREA